MTIQALEPGISAIINSQGKRVGYLVEGWTRCWRTLHAARLARRRVSKNHSTKGNDATA